MTSSSCIRMLKKHLSGTDCTQVLNISLGRVYLQYDSREINLELIENVIINLGFSVIKNPKIQFAEEIKTACIELIQFSNNASTSMIKNSEYLSERLCVPYDKISRSFSEIESITLERYILLLKVEKIKELISYNELSLSEISFMMDYSSVQYLSTQFKKVTGYTVSQFKENPEGKRVPLDELLP